MELIFIEDETETRKGILKYVNWEKLGIDSVIPFANPLEALSYAKHAHIDIVLSDIRMPHMDGIQLCQSILNINPSASIIFISGYSDKEYLLNAIKMSAVDYVEKPVNISQLEAAITKAVRQILTRQNTKQSAPAAFQNNLQLYTNQIITDLIHGHVPFTDAASSSDIHDLQHAFLENFPLNSRDFYRVYLWCCHDNTNAFDVSVQTIFALLKKQPGMLPFLIFKKDEHNYLLLTRFSSRLACDTQQLDMILMQGIRKVHAEHSISCSYGNLLQGAENITTSYQQAVLAIQKTFYNGYGTILPYPENGGISVLPVNSTYPFAPIKELEEELRKHDRTACENCLKNFYKSIQTHTDILPDMIKNEYFQLLSVFSKESSQISADLSSESPTRFFWKQLNSLQTLEECHNFCLSELTRYFDRLKDTISDKKIISEVIQYIQKQYSNHDLYIEQIAKAVHLSPNYLSSLFKKETGKTIGSYITEVRLKQSCYLLNSDRKISDIALSVGYTDVNYYSKLFKKFYHVTPSEYRNHISIK